jgi:hypothetical protein
MIKSDYLETKEVLINFFYRLRNGRIRNFIYHSSNVLTTVDTGDRTIVDFPLRTSTVSKYETDKTELIRKLKQLNPCVSFKPSKTVRGNSLMNGIPDWLSEFKCSQLISSIVSISDSAQIYCASIPLRLLIKREVSYLRTHYYEDLDNYLHLVSLTLLGTPSYSGNYELDLSTYRAQLKPHIYPIEVKCCKLQSFEYPDAFNIAYGELNWIYDFKDFVCIKFSFSRFIGMIRSVHTVHKLQWSKTRLFIIRHFPLFEDIFSRRTRPPYLKDEQINPIWFLDLLPPEIFFLSHRTDKFYLRKVLSMKVHSLRDQLLNFAQRYLQIQDLSPTALSIMREERKKAFLRILKLPEIQLRFAQGEAKASICDYIYNNFQPLLIKSQDMVLKSSHASGANKKSISNLRHKERDLKYLDNFEYHSFVSLTTTNILGGVAIYTFCLMAVVASLIRFIWSMDQKTTLITRVVQETLDSWTPSRVLSLSRTQNPENILLCVEVCSLLNIIYEWQYGTKVGMLRHAGYLVITRGPQFVETLSRLIQHPGIFTRESDEDSSDNSFVPQTLTAAQAKAFSDACGQIAAFIQSHFGMKIPEADIRLANQEFTYLNNIKRDVSDKFSLMMNVISVMCRVLFAFDPFDQEFQKFSLEVLNAIQDISKLEQIPPATNEQYTAVLSLYERYTPLRVSPQMLHLPTYLGSLLSRKLSVLEELSTSARCILGGDTRRVEPVCILFSGEAGTGKTTAMGMIQRSLAKAEYKGKIDNWTRTAGSPYMEGYRNQPFVTIDEFFSSTDVEKRYEEALMVVAMVNSAPYAMNMAFQDKGKTFFNSHYIFMTSNALSNNTALQAGLTADGALLRRLSIHVESKNIKYTGGDLVFTVRNCVQFPQYNNLDLNPGQLANLMIKIRQYNIRHFEKFESADAELIDLNHENNLLPDIPDPQDRIDLARDQLLNQFDQLVDDVVFSSHSFPTWDNLKSSATQCWNTVTGSAIPQMTWANDNIRNTYITLWAQVVSRERADLFGSMTHEAIKGLILIYLVCSLGKTAYSLFQVSESFTSHSADLDNLGKSYRKYNKQAYRAERYISKKDNSAKYWINVKGMNNVPNGPIFMHSKIQTATQYGNLVKSVVKLTVSKTIGDKLFSTQCLALHICNGMYAICAHFAIDVLSADEGPFNLVRTHASNENLTSSFPDFTFSEENLVLLDNLDLAFLKLPPGRGAPSQLYDKLCTLEELQAVSPSSIADMRLVGVNNMGQPWFRLVQLREGRITHNYNHSCGERLLIVDGFTYTSLEDVILSTAGDSGAMLCVTMADGQVRVVGMHMGIFSQGATRNGPIAAANMLPKELIEDMRLVPAFVTHSAVDNFPLIVDSICDKPSTIPGYSKIKPTEFYGFHGPPTCVPAKMRSFMHEGQIVDPLSIALNSYSQVELPVEDMSVYSDLVEGYFDFHYNPIECAKFKRILTKDEALSGCYDLWVPPIDATTSSGYPFSLEGGKGKNIFVKTIINKHVFTPRGSEVVDILLDKVVKSQPYEVIWMDVLKDETRPIAKVLAGKTRIFSTCPFDYLIVFRMYFGAFFGYMQSRCLDTPVSVGINPHSIEWQSIYEHFLHDPARASLLAGDFSKFDKRHLKPVSKLIIDYINHWYSDGPANAQIRLSLMEKVWYSKHLIFHYYFMVIGGMPSGCPYTAQLNSMYQLILWLVVVTQDFKLSHEAMRIIVYGDDNIVLLPIAGLRCSDFAPHFMRRFHLDYTHFTKEESSSFDTINTIRYLGRSFFKYGNRILAPLELSTIYESIYWKKNSLEPEQHYPSVVSNYIMELSHFPERIFEEEKQKLFSELTRKFGANSVSVYTKTTYPYKLYHIRHYMTNHSQILSYHESVFNFETHSSVTSHVRLSHPTNLIPENYQIHPSDNTDMTTRGAKVVTTTQEVPLGDYQDAAPVTASSVNSELLQAPYQNNNMEIFSLSEVLNREFLVASTTWGTGSVANTTLFTLDFPKVLFDQTFIADKVKNFRYFRAGIRLSIRISASQFNYGAIMLAYIPDYDEDAYHPDRIGYIARMSGYPHVIVSAAQSESTVFDIPFIHSRRALDIMTSGTFNRKMGSVICKVLTPLTNINAQITSTRVFVTAQFLDAELYGPFQPQSAKSESTLKSSKGVISSFLEKTASVASILGTVPLVSHYANLYSSVAKDAASVARIMGMDKPTSLARTDITKVNPFSDIPNSKGIDCSVKLSLDPENGISTTPNVAGVSTDEHMINYIAGTPTLYKVATFSETSVIGSSIELFSTDLDTVGSTGSFLYAQELFKYFQYWSGSFKLKVYIHASNMHAARLVFYLNPTSTATNAWQSCYHMVVDVQGDTEVELSVPYFPHTVIADANVGNTKLFVSLVSYSQPTPGVVTPIYLNCYGAMGSDFELYAPVDKIFSTTFIPQSNPRLDFQKDFPYIHPSMTGYKTSGFVIGERVTTIRDLMHRYQPVGPVGVGTRLFPRPTYCGRGNLGTGLFIGLESLGLMFRYYRGSVRFKILQLDELSRSVLVFRQDTGAATSAFTASSSSNPLVEFEVPWYEKALYLSTSQNNEPQYTIAQPKGDAVYEVKAAGDDFSFHFLCPPPLTDNPSNAFVGVSGVVNYFAQAV